MATLPRTRRFWTLGAGFTERNCNFHCARSISDPMFGHCSSYSSEADQFAEFEGFPFAVANSLVPRPRLISEAGLAITLSLR